MKPVRIVVMGVCGCGKSEIGARLATLLECPFIEGDAYHPRVNLDKMRAAIPLSDDDRQGWLEILSEEIRAAREDGCSVVLACSALKRRYRECLRRGDPDLVFVYLHGTREQIRERMQLRQGHFMPLSLIDSQFFDLEPPQPDERCIACEIDPPPETLIAQIATSLGWTAPYC